MLVTPETDRDRDFVRIIHRKYRPWEPSLNRVITEFVL